MIKTFCDICEKEMAKDCSDLVNLDFNSYGCCGFEAAKKYGNEFNFCKDCATKVVLTIEDLKKKLMQTGGQDEDSSEDRPEGDKGSD